MPGESDVLIKVDACGLNPVDAKIAQWRPMVPTMDDQWVPGLDVSGRIVQTGLKVDRWRVGDLILCHGNMFHPHGGFAEYTIQDSEALIPSSRGSGRGRRRYAMRGVDGLACAP